MIWKKRITLVPRLLCYFVLFEFIMDAIEKRLRQLEINQNRILRQLDLKKGELICPPPLHPFPLRSRPAYKCSSFSDCSFDDSTVEIGLEDGKPTETEKSKQNIDQRYPLLCSTHFRNLKSAQQDKGYFHFPLFRSVPVPLPPRSRPALIALLREPLPPADGRKFPSKKQMSLCWIVKVNL